MNFTFKRKTTDKSFQTTIAFDSYGDNVITEEEEKAIIEDLGSPKINLGALTYKGKFKVNEDTRVIATDDSDGDADEITMIVNSKLLTLDSSFKAEYLTDSKTYLKSDYAGNTVINSPELLAEARCVLFENTVKEAVKKALTELKAKRTRFETVEIPNLTA